MNQNPQRRLRAAYHGRGEQLWSPDLHAAVMRRVLGEAAVAREPGPQADPASEIISLRPFLAAAAVLAVTLLSVAGMLRGVTNLVWDAGIRFGLFPGIDLLAGL